MRVKHKVYGIEDGDKLQELEAYFGTHWYEYDSEDEALEALEEDKDKLQCAYGCTSFTILKVYSTGV